MDVWGWIAVVFILSVVSFALWALVHQERRLPRHGVRVGDPDEPREREIIKWHGTTFGGGHG